LNTGGSFRRVVQELLARFFFRSAGLVLTITAVAKLIAMSASVPVLNVSDPILFIRYRHVLLLVATAELMVAGACFLCKRLVLQAGLVAWLSLMFVAYRLARWWIGFPGPCICLGRIPDAFHIKPATADLGIKCVLVYLICGSCATLLWNWRRRELKPATSMLECSCCDETVFRKS
jgi:hypothetical protein